MSQYYRAGRRIALASVPCSVLLLGIVDWIAGPTSIAQVQTSPIEPNDLAELKKEMTHLKAKVASYAAMNDVDYHAQNLWFAGIAENWPLADYYWQKIRSHIRLAKETLDDENSPNARLEQFARLIEKSDSMQVGRAIQKQDVTMFTTNYHGLLQGCYDCHKAVDKAFLRPRMPVRPAQAIINVDKTAKWPK